MEDRTGEHAEAREAACNPSIGVVVMLATDEVEEMAGDACGSHCRTACHHVVVVKLYHLGKTRATLGGRECAQGDVG